MFPLVHFIVEYLIILKCVIAAILLSFIADGITLGNGPFPVVVLNYLFETVKDLPMDLLTKPQNTNDSLGYRVYTLKNPDRPCFLEPTLKALRRCKIDADSPLTLFLHGFVETVNPGNVFEIMKDNLLANGPHTVIILDWTKYNGAPYTFAIENMKHIGPLAAEVLNFIQKHAGVKAENMRITGHSLGGHLAGYIGRLVPNLGRIDSLDPAGLFFTTPPFEPKLSYTDAKFVRAIHTSDVLTGIGTKVPLGHIDFYVNGGALQPQCDYGSRYKQTDGKDTTVDNVFLKHLCPHELVTIYYIFGINSTGCQFLATKCGSYRKFRNGKCTPDTSEVADMGYYGQELADIPPRSKFYLRTSSHPPYCLKNGYKPLKKQHSKNLIEGIKSLL